MEIQTSTNCCNSASEAGHKEKKDSFNNGLLSVLSTVLIILIPKCPFCIAAYSGVFLLFFDIQAEVISPFFLHVKPILGLLIVVSIAFNFNLKKSRTALWIALVALLLLFVSTYIEFSFFPDWILYLGFLFAVWYNGNFISFYNYLKSVKPAKV